MLFKGKLRGYKPSWLPSPSLWVNGTQNMTESDPEHGLRSCGKSGWQARNANHKDRHKKTWQKLDPMTSLLNVTLSHGFLSFDPWTCVMASGTSCIDPSGTKSRRWGIWVGWLGLGTRAIMDLTWLDCCIPGEGESTGTKQSIGCLYNNTT